MSYPQAPDIPVVDDDPFFSNGDSYFTAEFMMVWNESLAVWEEKSKPASE